MYLCKASGRLPQTTLRQKVIARHQLYAEPSSNGDACHAMHKEKLPSFKGLCPEEFSSKRAS